jgi:HlyD family secretion protein
MKKVLIALGIVVVLAVIILINVQKNKEKATKVQVETVERMDLTEIVSASGRIQPKVSVDISADITGKIEEVAVREGDRVAKGQLLLRLDPTQYRESLRSAEASYQSAQAALSEAEARLEQQELEWERSQALYDAENVSERDYQTSRTNLKLAQAQRTSAMRQVDQAAAVLEQQRDRLDKTEIRSPMSGVVVRCDADVGEMAIQSSLSIQVLLVIADLSVMEVEVDVDETEIPLTAVGQAAEVEIDAFPDSTFMGTVTEIANSPRETGGERGVDFRVVITLDSSTPGLRPGLSATAEITTAVRDSALAIPIEALTLRTRKSLEADAKKLARRLKEGSVAAPELELPGDEKEIEGVMVVEGGRAYFRPAETGITGEKHFELLSGLAGAEQIVVRPMRVVRTLRHGERVEIEKKADDEDDAEAEGSGPGVSVETE